MPPAARITDFHACPMVTPGTPPIPHVGGPIMKGSPNVLTGKLPQARVGDQAVCVGPMDVIVKGSSGVFVNKLPAARIGDQTAHGGTIVAGLPTVIIGETKAGGGGGGAMIATGAILIAYTEVIAQLKVLIDAQRSAAPFCEACFRATSKLSQAQSYPERSAVVPSTGQTADLRKLTVTEQKFKFQGLSLAPTNRPSNSAGPSLVEELISPKTAAPLTVDLVESLLPAGNFAKSAMTGMTPIISGVIDAGIVLNDYIGANSTRDPQEQLRLQKSAVSKSMGAIAAIGTGVVLGGAATAVVVAGAPVALTVGVVVVAAVTTVAVGWAVTSFVGQQLDKFWPSKR